MGNRLINPTHFSRRFKIIILMLSCGHYYGIGFKNLGSRHHAERDECVLITLRLMVPSIVFLKYEFDASTSRVRN